MIDLKIDEDFAQYHSLGEDFLFSKLEEQKNNIDKKLHIFHVFKLLTNLQKMLSEEEFLNSGVHFLSVTNFKDYDYGYLISFETLDESQKEIDQYEPNDKDNYTPICDKLKELFENISLDKFCSDDFKEKDERIFSIGEYLVENFKNLLLNNELKAVFDHTLLNNCLSEKEQCFAKLNKI